jgi:hypothetical protein
VQLNLATWTLSGTPTEAILLGRIVDGAVTASGKWSEGGAVAGNWKRTQVAAATPAAATAPKGAAQYDGTYNGQLCNQFQNKPPNCWQVTLTVRNGIAEGSWLSRTQNTSKATGTISANGAMELKLAAWTPQGNPTDGVLLGRVANDAITASGKWRDGLAIAGDWKRAR